ncbi:MAG: sigma-70 family RNA polymerase sigma factor [Bacteroidota bacterium]
MKKGSTPRNDHEPDDLDLWKNYLQTGDRQALSTLYERYVEKLIFFAYFYTQDRELARDLVQEAFKKLIEQKYVEIYDFEGYLKKAIYFLWLTECEKRKVKIKHLPNYKESMPWFARNHTSIDAERYKQLIDRSFKPKDARIIHMAAKGFKNQDIADELGLTNKQVRTRKSELKKKLKTLIGWK